MSVKRNLPYYLSVSLRAALNIADVIDELTHADLHDVDRRKVFLLRDGGFSIALLRINDSDTFHASIIAEGHSKLYHKLVEFWLKRRLAGRPFIGTYIYRVGQLPDMDCYTWPERRG